MGTFGRFFLNSNAEEIPLQSSLMDQLSDWDIAVRYHELKARRSPAEVAILRRLSAKAILERAQKVIGSVTHPMDQYQSLWPEVPLDAEQIELDLEETIENAPLAVSQGGEELTLTEFSYSLDQNEIWMSYQLRHPQGLFLSIDTSLSMTGEKLALTAVALAVVLLQFPNDPIGIVAFENEAKMIKHPDERVSIAQLVERFLDVPTQGYTHLEDGMKAVLRLSRLVNQRYPVVLLTDGKYTAGRDPSYLAPRFSNLIVLKMGKEKAGLELCRELAQNGGGVLREVGELESLPLIMYDLLKHLLRGRVVA